METIPVDLLRKRVDEDLDSVSFGSDSKAKVKVYFNSKVDSKEELLRRIDLTLAGLSYLKNQIEEKSLLGVEKK